MTELEPFGAQDRVLVVAPHPDDESLGTGGVLQAAAGAGAARRVLIVTDGDNNPWPQRWAEKRWHIGREERSRWGARRRGEALAALHALGVDRTDVRCFGLPDLGLTDALMRGTPDVESLLLEQLEQFRPTHVFLPSLADRHPDHSALHVLLRLALSRASTPAPRLHAFGVHGSGSVDAGVVLTLSAAQVETKRRAIAQHTSQTQLSGRRFLAFAKTQEPFRSVTPTGEPDASHPLQATWGTQGDLRIRIDHRRAGRNRRGHALFLVVQRPGQPALRAWIDLKAAAAGRVMDGATNVVAGEFAIEHRLGVTDTRIRTNVPGGRGWIKFARRSPGLFVLDRCGWQTIAPREPEQHTPVR